MSLDDGLPLIVTVTGHDRGISEKTAKQLVVSIVDDHPDFRHGVLARLPRTNSSCAAGVMATTVQEFLTLDAAEPRRSDVVLLDLHLQDQSAPVQNIARLKGGGYSVVIYTAEERPERLLGTLGVGAHAVVRKDEAERLEEALIAVVNGDHGWVSPLMASVVLAAPVPRLSSAQAEVLHLILRGGSRGAGGALAELGGVWPLWF